MIEVAGIQCYNPTSVYTGEWQPPQAWLPSVSTQLSPFIHLPFPSLLTVYSFVGGGKRERALFFVCFNSYKLNHSVKYFWSEKVNVIKTQDIDWLPYKFKFHL